MIEKRYSEIEEAFFRNLCFPEEERHRYTWMPWDGSFRWFKAGNVICLEHWRRAAIQPEPKSRPAA